MDDRGRLSIPSCLRDELGEEFHVTLAATRSVTQSKHKHLVAYSKANWGLMNEKYKAMTKTKKMQMRPIFSHASKCDLDSQGRILISQDLREWAGFRKNITVVGDGECVEFWDSEEWAVVDALETTVDNILDIYAENDF